MQMLGEQRVAAPRQKVWEALNDPAVLQASIPGCQTLSKEAEDRFSAIVEIKVGPIGARFKGAVSLSDINAPDSYTLNLEGNGGIAGSVKGLVRVRLEEDSGATLVRYEADTQVGGRMAQLGGPVIDATAKQLAGRFFSRFGEIVSGVKPAVAAPAAVPAAAAAPAVAAARPAGSPVAWVLALIIAAATGFFFGHQGGSMESAWAGLAIGLLLLVVAAAAFEYGRRTAQPTMVLDAALLRRLTSGD
ncbi:CoxG family protein [Haliea sp. E17]|uniref:CoxG family protein n=1 Tax=Haliea sp. E17 TaxID=3401576 RepID=UPI003AADBA29